jgi:hypothetical protein
MARQKEPHGKPTKPSPGGGATKPASYIWWFLAVAMVVLAYTQRDRIKRLTFGGEKGANFEFQDGRPSPFPSPCFETRTSDHPISVKVSYTDWKPEGPDGQGGTILSYKLVAPEGTIKAASLKSCPGCGSWLWICPEPRCPDRPAVQRLSDTIWVAWAATNGASPATPIYEIVYTTTEQVKVPCPRR